MEEERIIAARLENSRTIQGSQKLHAFVPVTGSKSKLITREFSPSECSNIVTVNFQDVRDELPWNDIHSYVTCEYDGKWWLAHVVDVRIDTNEVNATFLHPSGPAPSFTYPRREDVLVVPRSSILTKVDPMTNATGRTYSLSQREINRACNALDA